MKKALSLLFSLTLLLASLFALASCKQEAPHPAETTGTPARSFTVALDLTEAWNEISDKTLVQGCMIVSSDFAAANEGAVVAFLGDYRSSIEWMKNKDNLETAAQYAVDAGILPNVGVAKQAIPRCNLAFLSGDDMVATVNAYFSALGIAEQPAASFFKSDASASAASLKVGYLSGPTGLGLAKMIADYKNRENVSFTKYGSPQEIMTAYVKGEIDFATLPTNGFPQFKKNFKDKRDFEMIALNEYGVLYLLSDKGETISPDDLSVLSGKTVYVPEQAPKLILEHVLSENGITDVTLNMDYDLDTLPAEAVSNENVHYILLPEPKVTVVINQTKSK